jgi:3-methyl-2-oxobutanoate hydroxymethyltransferase
MSTEGKSKVVTTYRLSEMKARGEKISMLTAYDYSTARILDASGIDVILVGDSAAGVMAGHVTTVPMTLDNMIYHGRSVVRGVERALVVVDLPFGTYQGNSKEALASAIRIMKETEAHAVKLEGGAEILESVSRILSAGIPVMGHLGLTPQSINKFGTYAVRARDREEAEKLENDARLLEKAGCFALVLEKIPAQLGKKVASQLRIPVIGIGAGGGVDGQVLVVHDMLGINNEFSPRFLRRYADLYRVMKGAFKEYIADVKSGDFPSVDEQYSDDSLTFVPAEPALKKRRSKKDGPKIMLHDEIIRVLKEEGRPMRYEEIAEKITEAGRCLGPGPVLAKQVSNRTHIPPYRKLFNHEKWGHVSLNNENNENNEE